MYNRNFLILALIGFVTCPACDNPSRPTSAQPDQKITSAQNKPIANAGPQEASLPDLVNIPANIEKIHLDYKLLEEQAFHFAEGPGSLEEAMGFFSSTVLFDNYGLHLIRFAERLALEDPKSGFEWLIKQERNGFTCSALSKFAETLYRGNLPLAQELAKNIPFEKGKDAYYAGITHVLADTSVDSAVTFLQTTYADEPRKLAFAAGALIASVANNPQEVLRLSELFPNSVSPETYGEALFQVWKTDKALANERLNNLQDPKLSANIWSEFTRKFVREDYVGASEWAASLSPGSVRDTVTAVLARDISNNFPVDAFRWSLSIQDAAQRKQSIGMVIDSARNYDRDGAQKAIDESNLSVGEKKQLTGRIIKQN